MELQKESGQRHNDRRIGQNEISGELALEKPISWLLCKLMVLSNIRHFTVLSMRVILYEQTIQAFMIYASRSNTWAKVTISRFLKEKRMQYILLWRSNVFLCHLISQYCRSFYIIVTQIFTSYFDSIIHILSLKTYFCSIQTCLFFHMCLLAWKFTRKATPHHLMNSRGVKVRRECFIIMWWFRAWMCAPYRRTGHPTDIKTRKTYFHIF